MRTHAPLTIPATAPMLQYRRAVGDINHCLPAGISLPHDLAARPRRGPLVTTALAGGPPRSTDGASSDEKILRSRTRHDPLCHGMRCACLGACLGNSARA